jgi:L-fuculose-phosphate aldolase
VTFAAERAELCDAGRRLLAEGLVARTWGNLSIRVDEHHFIISPSGRTYDTVMPEDVALIRLADLGWSGPLKPSSEKELHARVYRARQEVGAVVHTHQPAASSLAAARRGFVPQTAEERALLGEEVPCAPYALPTTKALAKAVEKTVSGSSARAVLLSNHGALCLGGDMQDSIRIAIALEAACETVVLQSFAEMTGVDPPSRAEMLHHYMRSVGSVRQREGAE